MNKIVGSKVDKITAEKIEAAILNLGHCTLNASGDDGWSLLRS